jgi:hypothetical protein
MINKIKVVGVAGLAGSGKDLFFELCKRELLLKNFNPCRIALADGLKEECKEALLELFNIDPTKCNRDQKSKIRDFLVFYGLVKRKNSEGQHWIAKADSRMKELSDNCTVHGVPNPIYFVTDVRYDKYKKDECHWIKNKEGGLLVHLRKKNLYYGDNLEQGCSYETPTNKQEATNDPKLRKKADVCIEWPDCEGDASLQDLYLKPAVKTFVEKHISK